MGLFGQGAFARQHSHQVLAFVAVFRIGHFVGGFFAVNGQPPGFDQHLALGLEMLLGPLRGGGIDHADAGGHLVFGAGEEDGHEAACHQVVQLLLGLGQAAGGLQGGDDGKVIADLGVVKNALVGPDVAVVERLQRKRGQVPQGGVAVGQHGKGLLGHGQVVFGQGA